MGERKVVNKYYPADFDHSKLPKRQQPKNHQMNVRNMMPMTLRCNTCGNFIYKGTKFNTRKELVSGETYLGIPIYRFYFKCPNCASEITFKTDPKNHDYNVESGATRNFEPWRAEDEEVESRKRARDFEEKGDAMRCLENKTVDSKREMDSMVALDELKSIKSTHAKLTFDQVFATSAAAKELLKKTQEELDKALAKQVFSSCSSIKRVVDDEDSEDETSPCKRVKSCIKELTQRKRFILKPAAPTTEETSLKSLCGAYKDDED